MHARIDRGRVQLLTRSGLDWTAKYPAIAGAIATLGASTAYLDGELCGVRPDGTTSFAMIQNASDGGQAGALVFYLFDLLYLDGRLLTGLPLLERKGGLEVLLADLLHSRRSSSIGAFFQQAATLGVEGIVSKRVNSVYAPGNRGLWVKTKCLNRAEFMVVGWSDPEGSRHRLGVAVARVLRPGRQADLCRPRRHRHARRQALEGLQASSCRSRTIKVPLSAPPPRSGRFGSPLVLSGAHWVRPEMVVEVSFIEWTSDGLLRHVVYLGEREDEPATEVRRRLPILSAIGTPRFPCLHKLSRKRLQRVYGELPVERRRFRLSAFWRRESTLHSCHKMLIAASKPGGERNRPAQRTDRVRRPREKTFYEFCSVAIRYCPWCGYDLEQKPRISV